MKACTDALHPKASKIALKSLFRLHKPHHSANIPEIVFQAQLPPSPWLFSPGGAMKHFQSWDGLKYNFENLFYLF